MFGGHAGFEDDSVALVDNSTTIQDFSGNFSGTIEDFVGQKVVVLTQHLLGADGEKLSEGDICRVKIYQDGGEDTLPGSHVITEGSKLKVLLSPELGILVATSPPITDSGSFSGIKTFDKKAKVNLLRDLSFIISITEHGGADARVLGERSFSVPQSHQNVIDICLALKHETGGSLFHDTEPGETSKLCLTKVPTPTVDGYYFEIDDTRIDPVDEVISIKAFSAIESIRTIKLVLKSADQISDAAARSFLGSINSIAGHGYSITKRNRLIFVASLAFAVAALLGLFLYVDSKKIIIFCPAAGDFQFDSNGKMANWHHFSKYWDLSRVDVGGPNSIIKFESAKYESSGNVLTCIYGARELLKNIIINISPSPAFYISPKVCSGKSAAEFCPDWRVSGVSSSLYICARPSSQGDSTSGGNSSNRDFREESCPLVVPADFSAFV